MRKVKSVYGPSGSSGRSLSRFMWHEATRGISTSLPWWDASLSHGYPPALYTWVERGRARARKRTARSGDVRNNHEALYNISSLVSIFEYIFSTYLASSQAWYALSNAMWSLWREPANCLCTQPSLLRSDGVSNGSGKLVLAAIVHMASPQLRGE